MSMKSSIDVSTPSNYSRRRAVEADNNPDMDGDLGLDDGMEMDDGYAMAFDDR